MNNTIEVSTEEEDFMVEGFHKLDDRLLDKRPPKIKWGKGVQEMDAERRMLYMENIASTMNHAAYLIQEERNELGRLAEQKEQQLTVLAAQAQQAQETMQQQLLLINEERQQFNAENAKLKARIRELEAQLDGSE